MLLPVGFVVPCSIIGNVGSYRIVFFFQSHPSPSSSRKRCSFYRLSFLRRNREREREREPSTKNRRPRTGTARLELLLLLFNCFFWCSSSPTLPKVKKRKPFGHVSFPNSFFSFYYFFFGAARFRCCSVYPSTPAPSALSLSFLFYFFLFQTSLDIWPGEKTPSSNFSFLTHKKKGHR